MTEKMPFCLVTCASPRILEELELLVSTFRRHNPGVPILCVGDGMKVDCKRLGLEWRDYKPDWDFKTDCGRMRCLALREGLRRAQWALYADADVIFTAKIPADTFRSGLQVLLSEHYVDSRTAGQYGRFNSGYIATCDPAFTEWWPFFTEEHPELFCEQKPLEFAPTRFKCGMFDPGHNVGFWRMACAPAGFDARWTKDNRVDGWPVVSIHAHLKNYGGRPGQGYNFYQPFADLARQRVKIHQGPVRRLILYVPWYRATSDARQAEIDEATQRNLAAGADEVVLLIEEKDMAEAFPTYVLRGRIGAQIETTRGRQTFADVYALSARTPSVITVWINADCYFGTGALDAIRSRDMAGQFVCVSRWDGEKLNETAWGSQDAWAILPSAELVGLDDDLAFGTPNIDHTVNARMKDRGYELHNPCREVRVQHLHASSARNYPPALIGPVLFVWPEEKGVSAFGSKPPLSRTSGKVPHLVQLGDAVHGWKVGTTNES